MDDDADYATMSEDMLPEELSRTERPKQLRKRARIERLKRMCAELLAGRSFVGRAIFEREAALQSDETRLEDIGYELVNGLAISYWVDGSYADRGCEEGIIGAGVVGVSGRYTGSNRDAELFAIALALDHAKNLVQRGAEFRLVRIYTDALQMLETLNHSTPSARSLGPLIPGEITALEVLFGHTEWLDKLGISTELIWVKGHGASNGNNAADALAALAVSEHADLQAELCGGSIPERKTMTLADAPAVFKSLGHDWMEEWLYRANFGLDLIIGPDISQMLSYENLSKMMMKPPVPGQEKPMPKKSRPWDTPSPLRDVPESTS